MCCTCTYIMFADIAITHLDLDTFSITDTG
jgi:hypothetical protein